MLSDKKISQESLIPCKSAILWKANKQLSKLKTRIKTSKSNPVLKQIYVISCLEALQKKFILVPIDKASNNVAIIRKRYYGEMILNKISVIGHQNNTHCEPNISCDYIIDENTEYIKLFGFKIT